MENWFVWKITARIVRVNWPRASQSWWHSSPSTFSPPLGEPNKIYECDFTTRPYISGAWKEIAKAWIRSHRSSGSLICSLQWILDLPVVHLDRPFKLEIPEPLHELVEWCVVIFARIFDKKLPVFRPYFYKNEPGWRIGHTGLGLLQVESTCWFGYANGIWMDGKESAELPSMQHSIYLGLLNWAPGKQKIYLSNFFPHIALE